MAIDNSLYDALEATYYKIENYLASVKMGPEHSPVIIMLEQLGALLETFDVEALEEQTKNINGLHDQLNAIKALTDQIHTDIDTNSSATAENVAQVLESVFSKIDHIEL